MSGQQHKQKTRKLKRKPLQTNKYIHIHENNMVMYETARIFLRHDVTWNFEERPAIHLEGKIFITDVLCLNVSKTLDEVNGRVLTSIYGYNLNTEGKKNSEVFRYDNFDIKPRKGHESIHHVHHFNPPGNEIFGSPFELAPEEVPTLGQVIEEAFEYAVKMRMRRKRAKQRDCLERTGKNRSEK